MKRALLALACVAACTPASRDELTRDAARAVIFPLVDRQFPGVPLDRSLDCVIANATSDELLALASDSATGPTASTREIVGNIATRSATLQCIATEGLPALTR